MAAVRLLSLGFSLLCFWQLPFALCPTTSPDAVVETGQTKRPGKCDCPASLPRFSGSFLHGLCLALNSGPTPTRGPSQARRLLLTKPTRALGRLPTKPTPYPRIVPASFFSTRWMRSPSGAPGRSASPVAFPAPPGRCLPKSSSALSVRRYLSLQLLPQTYQRA